MSFEGNFLIQGCIYDLGGILESEAEHMKLKQFLEINGCKHCGSVVEDGIACDFCSKWFHFPCARVSVDAVPEGEWKCFYCQFEGKLAEEKRHADAFQERMNLKDTEVEYWKAECAKLTEKLAFAIEENREVLRDICTSAELKSPQENFKVVERKRKSPKQAFSSLFCSKVTQPELQCRNSYSALADLEDEEPEVATVPANNTGRPRRKRKVLILGSSHARGMGECVKERLGEGYDLLTICKPNAGLGSVAEDLSRLTEDFCKSDRVVIVGGLGNSIDRFEKYSIGKDISNIARATSHTSVLICETPQRHDKPILERKVQAVNAALRGCVGSGRLSHIGVIGLEEITRADHTRHGLHLNRSGKGKLADLIAHRIQGGHGSSQKIQVIVGNRENFLG